MDLKKKFEELVEKRDSFKIKLVESETQLKVAQDELSEIFKELQSKYNVSSVDEAKEKLDEMRTELEKEISECEEALAKFEVD